MAVKKSPTKKSHKSEAFSFSWYKLIFGLSVAFSLASIVFLVTIFKTAYFDTAITQMVFERNLDSNGCYVGDDKGSATNKICIVGVGVDSNNKVVAPEWLKGQTFPRSN